MTPARVFEACVETVEEALAAEAGGADRVELCTRLDVGGLTPEPELLAACRARLSIPIFVLLRPRAGDFVFTSPEWSGMWRDAGRLRSEGASGVVAGGLRRDGRVAVDEIAALQAHAALPITFHRAFDACPNQAEALEDLAGLGIARVLTAGGPALAQAGRFRLRRLVEQAGRRIVILAGGGIRADNVARLVRHTGVTEVHAHLGPDAKAVRRLVDCLRA